MTETKFEKTGAVHVTGWRIGLRVLCSIYLLTLVVMSAALSATLPVENPISSAVAVICFCAATAGFILIGFAGLAFISVWLTRDANGLRNENIKRCGRLMALAIGLILPAPIFFTSLMVKFALADDSIEYFQPPSANLD